MLDLVVTDQDIMRIHKRQIVHKVVLAAVVVDQEILKHHLLS